MDSLNSDMLAAIKQLNLNEQDEQILIEILYNERDHKNEAWSNDAAKSFKKLIDDLSNESVSK